MAKRGKQMPAMPVKWLEHRCNHRRGLAHQCAGRQTTGNYRRGYRGRSVSARANDGPDKVCGWPSGSPNRHRDLITFYSYLVLAQGQLRSLTRWGHLMNSKDQQNYSAQ